MTCGFHDHNENWHPMKITCYTVLNSESVPLMSQTGGAEPQFVQLSHPYCNSAGTISFVQGPHDQIDVAGPRVI